MSQKMGATKAGKVVLKRNSWMNISSETLLGFKRIIIIFSKVQQLVFSVFRCLWTVAKRRVDATPWQTWPCPNFFVLRAVAAIRFKMSECFL